MAFEGFPRDLRIALMRTTRPVVFERILPWRTAAKMIADGGILLPIFSATLFGLGNQWSVLAPVLVVVGAGTGAFLMGRPASWRYHQALRSLVQGRHLGVLALPGAILLSPAFERHACFLLRPLSPETQDTARGLAEHFDGSLGDLLLAAERM